MNVRAFLTKIIPDKLYLQLVYYRHFHRFINFKEPKTFNEKINWLKLYNRDPNYTKMVDKYAVREYIAEKLGEEYLIPLLGVWDDPHDIDFDKLPNQFVLKWNHDSGSVIICRDKTTFNELEAVEKLCRLKKHNGYNYGRGWPYKNVVPKIVAEQYMVDESGHELKDYKLFCFNGEPRLTLVCSDRFSAGGMHEDFFDEKWNHMPMERPHHRNSPKNIVKPLNYEKMLEMAQCLSKDMPFARIDFYEINGMIYFGEITFYPASGFEGFDPDSWDYTLGNWIDLPKKK